MDSIQVVLKDQNVPKENAEQLLKAFGAPFEEAGKILASYKEVQVTDVTDVAGMEKAKSMRKKLKEIRVGVEHKRKELKEDSLRVSQAIDSVARRVKEEIEPAEKYLEEQEKFAEIKAAEEKAKVTTERLSKLAEYTTDVTVYSVEDMSVEQFDTLVAGLEAQKQQRIKEEKEAEAARLAEIEAEKKRQAEIEAENAKLKAEAEARELALEKERQAERKKQTEIDAKRDAELKAEREKAEAERVKREEVERKQREQDEIQARIKAEAEEKERQALLSPDKDKLIAFANALDMIRREKLPAVKTKQAQEVVDQIDTALASLSEKLTVKAKQL